MIDERTRFRVQYLLQQSVHDSDLSGYWQQMAAEWMITGWDSQVRARTCEVSRATPHASPDPDAALLLHR